MVHLYPLLPKELTEDDVKWLVKLGAGGYDRREAKEFVAEALAGECALWRLSGGPKGVLVTRLQDRPEGKELWIDGFAGEGLIAHALGIRDGLLKMAKRAGASLLSGQPHRPGLYQLYESLGLKPVARVYSIGVGHGE